MTKTMRRGIGGRVCHALAATATAAALYAAQPALADKHSAKKSDGVTTLAEALESALLSSPELATQVQALRGLDEAVAQARSGFRPTVSGTVSTGRSFTDNSELRDRRQYNTFAIGSLNASQALFDGFQTHFSVKSANASVESGRFTLFQTEQTVLLNAITAYIQIRTAQQNVRLARNNVEVIERQLQAARDRFEVGEVTRTDVAQAEAALAQSQSNLATQLGTLRQAKESYRRFVGQEPGRLASLPPTPELPSTLDEAREVALNRQPQILAAKANVDAASFSIRQAQGALMPQVDWTGTLQGTSNSFDGQGIFTAQTQIQVSVPLYTGGALRSQIRQNKALESQRFQELRDIARQVLQNTGNAWQDLLTARATTRSSRKAVEAQQIAFEGVREEAKVGQRTTLDVLEAEQDLLDARVALVTSRANEQISSYTLLSAVGVLTIETLDLPVTRHNPELYHDWSQGYVDSVVSIDDPKDDDWLNNWRP